MQGEEEKCEVEAEDEEKVCMFQSLEQNEKEEKITTPTSDSKQVKQSFELYFWLFERFDETKTTWVSLNYGSQCWNLWL